MSILKSKRRVLAALTCISPFLLLGCDNDEQAKSPVESKAEVAFLADVHFHDVYGDLKSSQFQGIPTEHGHATIRTMYDQLTSTRLFNENYFAFRSALDSAYEKGIRIIAFPGDFSDDGQPMHVAGFKKILTEYEAKGMRFFIAPGNHDPVAPHDNDTAKEAGFLDAEGKSFDIFALQNQACLNSEVDNVCTNEMMELGYESLLSSLGEFGFMPNKADVYWETPFSTYNQQSYNLQQATAQASVDHRLYEVCKEGEGGAYKQPNYTQCTSIPDVSYLVEPVPGLWLLSVDANVFVPKDSLDPNDPTKPGGFTGAGSAGWNQMVTHKKTTMKWIASVAERAKAQNKKLVAFSHYPTIEFYANQTDAIKQTFGGSAFQTNRVPTQDATQVVASTGLGLHVGGHMHSNSTNDYTSPTGSYLVNIQSPSLAVYGAAYKILRFNSPTSIDVETVKLDEVERFDELFPLYEREHQYLTATQSPRLWDKGILSTKSYKEFTHFYFGQLSKMRFMNEYWPCEMRDLAEQLNLGQMLIMSQLNTRLTYAELATQTTLDFKPSAQCLTAASSNVQTSATEFAQDWQIAKAKAEQLAAAAGLSLADMEQVSAYDFYGDFHRTIYAGELALTDMGDIRVKQYKLLMSSFPEQPAAPQMLDGKLLANTPIHVPFQYKFKRVFSILKGVGSAKPSNQFSIDLQGKTISGAKGPSFN